LPILEASLGPTHATLLVCQFNLAVLLQQQALGLPKATSSLSTAATELPGTEAASARTTATSAATAETAAAKTASSASETAAAAAAAAAAVEAAAAVVEARGLLEAVCNGRTAALGPAHPDTLRALASLAALCSDNTAGALGGGAAYDLALACACAERGVRGRAARHGPRHWRALRATLQLASLLSRDPATRLRAARTYKAAAAALAESLGAAHPLHLQAQVRDRRKKKKKNVRACPLHSLAQKHVHARLARGKRLAHSQCKCFAVYVHPGGPR
jgi:hypothetical protein